MMKLEVGTRVELLPDKDAVYKLAVAGAQAVVKDRREDEGFQMIFIEWDKDHEYYIGEPDCWTFEAHFRPLEQSGLFHALEDRDSFLENIMDRAEEITEDGQRIERFIERLNDAVSLMAESEGFLLIAAKKEVDEGEVTLTPYVYSGYLDPKLMILLEAQIVQLAAISHQEAVSNILKRLVDEDEDTPD